MSLWLVVLIVLLSMAFGAVCMLGWFIWYMGRGWTH